MTIEMEKASIAAFIETLFGRELFESILSHPLEPPEEADLIEVRLEKVDEVEKLFYQLLPQKENAGQLTVEKLPIALMLWDLWWAFLQSRHHIYGRLGIRKGWWLVVPKEREVQPFIFEEAFTFNKEEMN